MHLRSLATALVRRGHEVSVFCRRSDGPETIDPAVLIRLLPDNESDHADWLRSGLADAFAEVVVERYSLSSGPAHEATRALGLPYVLEVNAPLVDEAARYRQLQDVEHRRSWEAGILASADAIIAVSEGIRQHALRLGVAAERVHVVHNGVDVARFAEGRGDAVRTKHGLGDAFVAGFCGSLKPWHGVDTLLRALASLPPAARALVVGDGPQRRDLDLLSSTLALEGRIVFTGAVSQQLVPSYLAAMDVAVAPFSAQENFYFSPIKVAEYLAAGLPVLATRQGDLPEIIGDAGLLVPPDDVAALAQALATLIGDADLRRRLADAARKRSQAFDWSLVASRVEDVLTAVCASLASRQQQVGA